MTGQTLLDGLLAVTLPAAAAAALLARAATTGVSLFVAFGLLSALAWTRLDALDVALAEAAIGAGVTGALLFDAVPDLDREAPRSRRAVPLLLGAALALALLACVWRLPRAGGPLGEIAAAHLSASGVAQPVTAVLLGFRGYDTLLEVAVLLAAVLATLSLPRGEAAPPGATSEALPAVARLVAPVVALVSAYMVWAGGHAPGGAFQGGAVGAGLLVLMALAGLGPQAAASGPGPGVRALLAGGLLVFVAIAGASAMGSGALLGYRGGWAHGLVLAIEIALWPATALTLLFLFLGGPPGRRSPR